MHVGVYAHEMWFATKGIPEQQDAFEKSGQRSHLPRQRGFIGKKKMCIGNWLYENKHKLHFNNQNNTKKKTINNSNTDERAHTKTPVIHTRHEKQIHEKCRK